MSSLRSIQATANSDGDLLEEVRFETVSLGGGPVYTMVRRTVGGRGGPALFGLIVGLGLWIILFLLAMSERLGAEFLSTEIAAVHVRLLVAIPLLYLGEQLFDTCARHFCASMVVHGLLPESDLARLDRTAAWISRLKDSWVLEAAIIAAAMGASSFLPEDLLPGLTSRGDQGAALSGSLAATFYWFVCLPIFRILVLRWILRLCLWTWLVYQISRSRLALLGTHPDLAGGLGEFETVQEQLAPFVVVIAALGAAGIAEQFYGGDFALGVEYAHVALTVAFSFLVTTGPALLFLRHLYECRLATEKEFAELSARYARGFEARWYSTGDPGDNELLGSADMQSMADISTAFSNVRAIRLIPVSRRLALLIFICSIAPFAPLALLQFPVSEILSVFFQRLFGF